MKLLANECHTLTLVQAMAWYRQAKSHYLNQCWPRIMSPYVVTRPQRVKLFLNSRPRPRGQTLGCLSWDLFGRDISRAHCALLTHLGPLFLTIIIQASIWKRACVSNMIRVTLCWFANHMHHCATHGFLIVIKLQIRIRFITCWRN